MTELRIYVVVRRDLEMPPAKLAVQVAHAALTTYDYCREREPERAARYLRDGVQAKIVLQIENEAKLRNLMAKCLGLGPVYLAHPIVDAGRTVFLEPTLTCVGIGPLWFPSGETEVVRRLRLYA